MKILILNNSDTEGGAAIANFRLFKALKDINSSVSMITQSKITDENRIICTHPKTSSYINFLKYQLDYFPARFYKKRENTNFSTGLFKSKTIEFINEIKPDIVHLSWICKGFIPIHDLEKIKVPIVWTLHDMWAFTGGCHYSGYCNNYMEKCGSCYQLSSQSQYDLTSFIWNRKNKYWKNLDLNIVTPSNWLANLAQQSSLFKNKNISVIPNGLNLSIFKPMNKNISRSILNLPTDKTLIMFGATSALHDKRKGFIYLKEALENLYLTYENRENVEIVIFGSSKPETDLQLPFKVNYLGILKDEIIMPIVYSCADVFIAPSKEDNLPNTIMESLACGIPCVAFDIGGISDMIDHKNNGYLVTPFDSKDMANGISWVIKENLKNNFLSSNAENKVKSEFDIRNVSYRYFDLYSKILNKKIN